MIKRILRSILIFTLALALVCTALGVGAFFGGTADNNYEGDIEMVTMTARITEISDKLEVEVIKGSYGAHGIYWMNADSKTPYFDSEGNAISRSDLQVGDTVEILYTGQTALSLPPQIFARKITVIEKNNQN